eukprot:CAMPEP_0113466930 /NCGR_PEP_ID=MMETSP0014_2-20120614/14542_1 /TAXON_ID=2857 /ORGANISM="Nitzschia sp." /LENGTH=479 /DNA_ID=CAMNT_0000359201 /DNA_START=159 /DNA_END=1598 /DNA_ORIENTATION=+ /assembly_acc=CAM_ASM_000159
MRTTTNLSSSSALLSKSGEKKEKMTEEEEEVEDCPAPIPAPRRREVSTFVGSVSSIMPIKITWIWILWICFLVVIGALVLYSMRSWIYSGEPPFFFAATTTIKGGSSSITTSSKIDTIRDAFDVLGLDLVDLDGTTTTQDVIHHRSCLHLYEQQAFPHYSNNYRYYNYNEAEEWSSNNVVGYDDGISYSPPLVHVTNKLYTEEEDDDDDDDSTVLLLSKQCSKTIRKAYRRRALFYHPDNWAGEENGIDENDENEEFFATIVEAYEILSDPTSRNNWIKCRNVDGCQGIRRGCLEKFLTLLTRRQFPLTFILPFWPNNTAMLVICCSMIWIVYYARVEASTAKQSVGTSNNSINNTSSNNTSNNNNNAETGGRRKRRQYAKGDVFKAASYIIKMWSELIQLAVYDNIAPSHGTGNVVSTKNSDSPQQQQQQQQADGTDFDNNKSSSNDWVVLPPSSPSSSSPPKPEIAQKIMQNGKYNK